MALVHEADPVLDVVKIGGKPGEILLTKKGSGLEVIKQISTLEVGLKTTPNAKWKDLLGPSLSDFPFHQRSINDAFLQSESSFPMIKCNNLLYFSYTH